MEPRNEAGMFWLPELVVKTESHELFTSTELQGE